jgi:hypothetical protein
MAPAEAVVLGSGLVRREGTCLTVISLEVVELDTVGSFHGVDAFCTAHYDHERGA